MRNFIKAAIAATAIGGATLAAVQPAEARDHTGAAVAAGIIGLGVGAAIASADRPHYYDTGYYAPGYYAPNTYGYAPSYGVVYERGYRGWDRGYDHRGYDHRDYDHRGYDHHDGWRR